MTAAIEFDHVTFQYAGAHEPTVIDASFRIEQGALCALVGANGSGKTTVCNLVRGFAPSFYHGERSGRILVHGVDHADRSTSELSTEIGYVFQNPFMQITGSKDTVFEEIAFGLENLGHPLESIEERVAEVIEMLGLGALATKNPFELSGGQKQRVAIASIFAMDPPVFVIDEPTSQLDPQSSDEIFEIITVLKSKGRTVLLTEHKVELIAEFADQVLVIQDGTIMRDGTAQEVLGDPQLDSFGIRPPAYAAIAHRLRAAGAIVQDKIPVTRAQAIAALRPIPQEQA